MSYIIRLLHKFTYILLFLFIDPIYSNESNDKKILYLISANKIDEAITNYLEYYTTSHNYPLLKALSHSILESGMNNPDDDIKLLSIYGAQISGQYATLPFMKNSLLTYKNPMIQKSLLNLVSLIHEGWADHFLVQSLRSPYIELRLEALHHLIIRNHPDAFGHIEALIRLVAPEFRAYFVELYAMDSSDASTHKLKSLLSDPTPSMQQTTLSKLIEHQREDFAIDIEAFLTHTDPSKQELAALAMGQFGITHAKDSLIKLTKSPYIECSLAANYALTLLGYEQFNDPIFDLAKQGNLFALNLLKNHPLANELLRENLNSSSIEKLTVSTLALLQKKDPVCKNEVINLLKLNTDHICLIPVSSLGGTLSYLNINSIYTFPHKEMQIRVRNYTKSILHSILLQSSYLPNEDFLDIAQNLLECDQTFLLPSIIKLLENINTDRTIDLLKRYSNSIGSPLIRYYSQLALYRLRLSEDKSLISWLKNQKKDPIFQILEAKNRKSKKSQQQSPYILSSDEKGSLFIETIEAIASRHDQDSINLILSLLQESHYKNKAILAGLLLKSIY